MLFKHLCEEVASKTEKWEEIATQLDISQRKIRLIEEDCNGDVQRCFRGVFDTWCKQRKHPFTWNTIITILECDSVEEKFLADTLCRKYNYMH